MPLTLDQFGEKLLAALDRIGNALETGSVPNTTNTDSGEKNAESAAEKKKRLAAEKKKEDEKNAGPKADRAAVNAALVALKDTVSKEAAQEVYQRWNYTAMSKIEEKDFDAVLAAANQELEDFKNKAGRYAESDLAGDDDL